MFPMCLHSCVLWWTSAELFNFLCRILLDQGSSLGLIFLIAVKLQSDILEECSSCEMLKTVHVSLISLWPSRLPVSSPAVDLPPQRWLLTLIVSPLTMDAPPFSCIDSFLQHSRSLSLFSFSWHQAARSYTVKFSVFFPCCGCVLPRRACPLVRIYFPSSTSSLTSGIFQTSLDHGSVSFSITLLLASKANNKAEFSHLCFCSSISIMFTFIKLGLLTLQIQYISYLVLFSTSPHLLHSPQ